MRDASFYKNFKRDIMLSINTSMPARVVSYDKNNREAKVQPLFKTKEKGKEPNPLPVLENVPVMFQRFEFTYPDHEDNGVVNDRMITREFSPVLYPGDVVMLSFSQRSMDKVLDGQVSYPDVRKLFRLRDAVVMGVIN